MHILLILRGRRAWVLAAGTWSPTGAAAHILIQIANSIIYMHTHWTLSCRSAPALLAPALRLRGRAPLPLDTCFLTPSAEVPDPSVCCLPILTSIPAPNIPCHATRHYDRYRPQCTAHVLYDGTAQQRGSTTSAPPSKQQAPESDLTCITAVVCWIPLPLRRTDPWVATCRHHTNHENRNLFALRPTFHVLHEQDRSAFTTPPASATRLPINLTAEIPNTGAIHPPVSCLHILTSIPAPNIPDIHVTSFHAHIPLRDITTGTDPNALPMYSTTAVLRGGEGAVPRYQPVGCHLPHPPHNALQLHP
jgi:hypothetical protein